MAVAGRPRRRGRSPPRPAGAEDALGVRADEPLQPEPFVQRVGMLAAATAGEVDPSERHVSGGGDEPAVGPAVTAARPTTGAVPSAPPFFSRSAACALS